MTRMKKAPPQLHADLAGAVREVLDRSPVPMNVAKLRSQLTGPFKVPAKLKDAFIALLAAEAQAGRIHEWPAAKYWIRDHRAWAEPIILAAAEVPVASSKVVGAISKQFGKPAAQALVGELIQCGMLIRVPMFGGAKAKLCSRIADEAAFRAELDAARLVIEAGYRRLEFAAESLPSAGGQESVGGSTTALPHGSAVGGGQTDLTGVSLPHGSAVGGGQTDLTGVSLPHGSAVGGGQTDLTGVSLPAGVPPAAAAAHADLATQVLDTLASLEPRKGLLVTAPRIYRALPGIPKSAIDEELLKLQDAHRVILHRHSNPQSSDELIGNLYVGACWRTQE